MVFCIASLLCLSCVCNGQNSIIDNSLKSYELPSNVEQYFKDKYKNQIDEVRCDLQSTPQGPKGHLSLTGHIVVRNQKDISCDSDCRIRSIAISFFQEEAQVLSISAPAEWRYSNIYRSPHSYWINDKEYAYPVDSWFVRIEYCRYINNVQVYNGNNNACIYLLIKEDNSISFVDAYLAPVSSDMYKAAVNKTISENDAAKIIEDALIAINVSTSKIQKTKLLIDKPPYVIWMSYGNGKPPCCGWRYEINAFTGEIVSKKCDCDIE